jgi:hypothetical protein
MKIKRSLTALCLVAFVLAFGAWQGMLWKYQDNHARGMQATMTSSSPAYFPYLVKALPSVTPSPTRTPEWTCPPIPPTPECTRTPCPPPIVCTPPLCPGGGMECCYDDGCPNGCGMVCIPTSPSTPTHSPTPTPLPTLTPTCTEPPL